LKIVYTENRPEILSNLLGNSRTVSHSLALEIKPGSAHQFQIRGKPSKPLVVHIRKEGLANEEKMEADEDEIAECLPCIAVQVADQFGNVVSAGTWNEQSRADIISIEPGMGIVPRLEESGRRAKYGEDGGALFATLTLDSRGCAGKCAAACKLQFNSGQLAPDEITLLITDDMELKRKIAQASEERAETSEELARLKERLSQRERDLKTCRAEKERLEKDKVAIKARLPGGVKSADLQSSQTVEELIHRYNGLRERVPQDRKPCADRSAERKVFGMPGFHGLLCDLAEIEDERLARVISWYLGRQRLEMVVCRSDDIMTLAEAGDGFRVLDTSMVKPLKQAGSPGKLQLPLPHGNQSLP
jgi:hypothetical protein